MSRWLMVLSLLVHESLAFEMYGDNDDYHLWRRGRPSVKTDDKDCKKDILVIWDNSQSVGEGPFKDKVIPFLINLIKSPKLNVGEHGTRFGFITFSSDERTQTLLKFGERTEPNDLETWLKSLNYKDLMGPFTYTGKAFQLADANFAKRSPLNQRPEIGDVILLFTDGQPRARTRKLKAEQERLAKDYSASLKNEKDVKIIGLAVGKPEVVDKFLPYIKEWSSPESVFKATLEELNNVLNQLVAKTCENAGGVCTCSKRIVPFVVYAGPGQQSARVTWPNPEAENEDGTPCKQVSVIPPDAVSGGRYRLGKHVISYKFSNDAANPTLFTCPVNFTVVTCNCPPTQTVRGKVKDGDKAVNVNWQEPVPNCPTTASPDNPKTRESFSVGKYTRTYKYSYRKTGRDSFELECRIDIVITGELCGETVFDPATKECCCGQIFPKKSGYKCCGNRYHHPRTEQCCNSVFCGVTTYDTNTQECCCGEVHEKMSDRKCCGKRYYSMETHQCCNHTNGVLFLKGEDCPKITI